MSLCALALLLSTATADRFIAGPTEEKLIDLFVESIENRTTLAGWATLRDLLQAPDREILLPDPPGHLITTHETALYAAELAAAYRFNPPPGPIRFIHFRKIDAVAFYRFHIPNAQTYTPALKARHLSWIKGRIAGAGLCKLTPGAPAVLAWLEHISIDLSAFSQCFLFLNFTLSDRRSVATAHLKRFVKTKIHLRKIRKSHSKHALKPSSASGAWVSGFLQGAETIKTDRKLER